jgi:hypothetical protein
LKASKAYFLEEFRFLHVFEKPAEALFAEFRLEQIKRLQQNTHSKLDILLLAHHRLTLKRHPPHPQVITQLLIHTLHNTTEARDTAHPL